MTMARTKEQRLADKAAKAIKAQVKQQARELEKAENNQPDKITEPAVGPAAKKVKLPDNQTNTLGSDTGRRLHTIARVIDSLANHNPPNIQDGICSIIRLGMDAYQSHTGQPFDTDLG